MSNKDSEEDFLEIDQNEVDNYKLERHSLIFYTVDKSVENLKKWLDTDKLEIPEFQRDFIWKYNNSVRFIESILLNLPIPSILVYKKVMEGREKYILVDGLQRMLTIKQFVNGKYYNENGEKDFKINLKNSKWYNKNFETLEPNDKEFFNDYSISVTIFEHPTDNEFERLNAMYDIFERINTGSEGLTSQEIRNAIYQGEGLTRFVEEANTDYFQSISSIQSKYSKRKRNVELLIRLNAYYYLYYRLIEDKQCMIDSTNEDIIENYKFTTNKNNMLNLYVNAINTRLIGYDVFDKININITSILEYYTIDVFKTYSRTSDSLTPNLSETFIESFLIAWELVDSSLIVNEESFNRQKLSLWRSNDFYDCFQSKSTSKENIIKRVEIMKSILIGSYKKE